MRISDWSSDVCSSDLLKYKGVALARWANQAAVTAGGSYNLVRLREELLGLYFKPGNTSENINNILAYFYQEVKGPARLAGQVLLVHDRSEEHTSEVQSLMRISYAVFCLKKKK